LTLTQGQGPILTGMTSALVPAFPAVVISFISAGLYLGQAISAALGDILLDHDATARVPCPTGVGIAMAAAGVHALASAASRRGVIG
jgi:hypothetical protein